MPFYRRHRRFSLWLALVAMCFGVLAPTVSHALAAAGSTAWVEVCTAQGMRWVSLDEGSSATPAEASRGPAAHLEHCPVCSSGGPGLAPPPVLPLWAPLPTLREGPPERFQQAPRTAHVWRAAQPRAPPFFS